MSDAVVRRLDGWIVVLLFLMGSVVLVAGPIFIMPSRVGILIGVFLGLVIAGSLHEIHRREKLGLPKPSDPFEFTAPIRILLRLMLRLVRIGLARFRGEVVDPSSLSDAPRAWCVIRDGYLRRPRLRVAVMLGFTLLMILVPVLVRPSVGSVIAALCSALMLICHFVVVQRRARRGLPAENGLLMFVAPLRVLGWMLLHVASRLQRGTRTPNIVKPPLFRLDTVARFLWSDKTYTRVFRAHQLEIIYEWHVAERNRAYRKANYIRYVRGPLTMLWHMFKQLPLSLFDLVFRASK